jgi:DnaJ domain
MRAPAALEVALTLAGRPALVRWASRMPLPPGITALLEVATGETGALGSAEMLTRRPAEALQSAAAFFIEQVLFTPAADSYRILGASRSASRGELRRHMALLIKWLHPDRFAAADTDAPIDRSLFIHRVTRAWETLKTQERRAAYDRMLPDRSDGTLSWHEPEDCALHAVEPALSLSCHFLAVQRPRRLIIYRLEGDTLFGRLLFYFRGQQG